jgi:phosphoglycolate phosphatase-like HAD superfamily hydrolase
MFGDRMEDMAAAKSAGIKSVGVMHSTHNEEQLLSMGADFIIKNWNEGMKNLNKIISI